MSNLALVIAALLVAATGCTRKNEQPSPDVADLALPGDVGADLAAPTSFPHDLAVPSTPHDLAQPPYVPVDGGPDVGIVELVSPAVCQHQNGRLVNCDIGTVVLHAPAPAAAAPYMTVLTTKSSGTCSTAYPLELGVQADSDPAVLFNPFNSERMLTLRRLDRAALGTVTVDNRSAWETKASYHDDCRLWVEVAYNLHDPS